MGGKTSNESKMKYNEKTYDKLTFAPRKDVLPRERIAAAAEKAGMSMNQYIIEAVLEKVNADLGAE